MAVQGQPRVRTMAELGLLGPLSLGPQIPSQVITWVLGDYLVTPKLPRGKVDEEEEKEMLATILVILFLLLLLGAVPIWPYSRDWGYYPGGIIGVILVILIILWLMGLLV